MDSCHNLDLSSIYCEKMNKNPIWLIQQIYHLLKTEFGSCYQNGFWDLGSINYEKMDSYHNLKSLQKQEFLDHKRVDSYHNEIL